MPASVLVPARCPRARAGPRGRRQQYARCGNPRPGRVPLPGVRAPGRSARSGGPRPPEPAARWLQSPSAGRTGRFAQGFEPRDASQGSAALGVPRALRAARAHSPHLRRCSGGRSDGASSRSLSAGPAAAPRAAHAAALARPAFRPRRRSIPRVCAVEDTAAAATRRAGGRAGAGPPGLGGSAQGGARPAPLPPARLPLRNLVAPGTRRPAKGGHGGVYGVPGRRPAVATSLPGSPSFPGDKALGTPRPVPTAGLVAAPEQRSSLWD